MRERGVRVEHRQKIFLPVALLPTAFATSDRRRPFGQLGNGVINVLAAFLFAVAAYWLISGVIDLILGIIVGRPSNVARWIIIVLDVISLLYVIDLLTRGVGGLFTLIPLVFLIGKAIVLYALLLDPPTRRNFAGTSR